jgi:hypothetical protein
MCAYVCALKLTTYPDIVYAASAGLGSAIFPAPCRLPSTWSGLSPMHKVNA